MKAGYVLPMQLENTDVYFWDLQPLYTPRDCPHQTISNEIGPIFGLNLKKYGFSKLEIRGPSYATMTTSFPTGPSQHHNMRAKLWHRIGLVRKIASIMEQ